jgi:hypothetical protein
MLTPNWKSAWLAIALLTCFAQAGRAELHIGTASTDITPDEPVPLCGQFRLRISQGVETPITANVLALESRDGGRSVDLAIMVSCDVVYIPADVLELVRQEVKKRLPDLETSKIFLAATHTHTAPELLLGKWVLPKEGVMSVERYRTFFAERVAEAIAKAWEGRAPGGVSWGLGHAVVAYNRRAVYANGSARMYGPTSVPEFRGLEGYEDHDVPVLFAWNAAGELIGMAVNVSCPSQEVESRSAVNADFWHPVREALQQKYGDQVCVLGWTGASGDQSPHLMYRKAAEERMRSLRGLTRLEEIARRVVRAVDEAYDVVKDDRHADVPLVHKVETIRLPMRLVTEAEYAEAKREVEQAAAQIEKDPKATDRVYRRMKWYGVTVERFEKQKTDPKPKHEMELHVVRIGDAVVCTNQFELFTDYGIRIKGRSKAVETFVVQLVGPGTYLPTERAVRGGHYSAIVHSSLVGPEGGQALVDRTVELIDSMWER